MHTYIHTCSAYIHTYTHVYIQTYIHAYTHTYIHSKVTCRIRPLTIFCICLCKYLQINLYPCLSVKRIIVNSLSGCIEFQVRTTPTALIPDLWKGPLHGYWKEKPYFVKLVFSIFLYVTSWNIRVERIFWNTLNLFLLSQSLQSLKVILFQQVVVTSLFDFIRGLLYFCRHPFFLTFACL